MSLRCDVAVIGTGFAGSLLAMALRRMGRSVVLIDRTHHPRFVIGESTTPLTNLLLEDFAKAFDLPEVASLAKWGSWQKRHPELACGLKRGFTFYHHRRRERFQDDAQHSAQLLVAASPSETVADTHWYRPDFDQFLCQQAETLGARCQFDTRVKSMTTSRDGCALQLERAGATEELRAQWVVDASGARGSLFRLLELSETPLPNLPRTQSLFAHFSGVCPTQSLEEFQSAEAPPYPPDAAATHHLFEGGWIWVLPFNNGITSAGVALVPELAGELGLSDGAAAWGRLLELLPSVRRQFEHSQAT
ncbi:MAG: FAD-dependent oxidoreductase, partial [Verrucomicrobia bacterium]|nr:FAD-dependent oxidoreductase [Verrucomicrobiota bacterium]